MKKSIYLILILSFCTNRSFTQHNDFSYLVHQSEFDERKLHSNQRIEKENILPVPGDLVTIIEGIRTAMPDEGTGTYITPNIDDEFVWRNAVRQMINAALSSSPMPSPPLPSGYHLEDIQDGGETYWVLMETTAADFPSVTSVTSGWGTFIIAPDAQRELFIQVPHPLNEEHTPEQGIRIFRETDSRAFLMAGTHRYASFNCSSIQCDNTPTAGERNTNNCSDCNCPCGDVASAGADGDDTHDQNGNGETDDDDDVDDIIRYRETDVAHETHSTFHWTVEEFFNIYDNYYGPDHNRHYHDRYFVALQFHGHRSCSDDLDIFITYGQNESLNATSGDIIHRLRDRLCANNGGCDDEGGDMDDNPNNWEVKIVGEPDHTCTLHGSRNVQGRLLNGLNADTYRGSDAEYSRRFIHIEQTDFEIDLDLTDDADGDGDATNDLVNVYRDADNWETAIEETFPTWMFEDHHWTLNQDGTISRLSNVGIGTNTPSTSLDINGALTVGNNGDNSTIFLNANNDRSARIGVQDDNGQGFFVMTDGRYRFSVNQNGNVMIGGSQAGSGVPLQNNLADEKLVVDGTLKLQSPNNHTIRIRVDNDGDLRVLGDDGITIMEIDDDDGDVHIHGHLNAASSSANVKSFKMDYPLNEGKELWYACIEGPEAAAYTRGTTKLRDGYAQVLFPEHFKIIANPKTMTVILTPLSAKSKGLAVVEKSKKGFKVRELLEGSGEYEFDWEVKCVRKGYEDFKIIRDKKD